MELYGSSGALESEGIHHAYLIFQPWHDSPIEIHPKQHKIRWGNAQTDTPV